MRTLGLIAVFALLMGCMGAVGAATAGAGESVDAKAIFDANTRGLQLYDEKKYEEAFPHLLLAAQNGFKRSQASLGGLYLYGLGVERSDLKGLAWLGTAARDTKDPAITQLFESVWVKVPEAAAPQVVNVIDQYAAKYGMDPMAHCARSRQAGSHISKPTCVYDDKYHTLLELDRGQENQATIGTRRSGLDPIQGDLGGGGIGGF